jgi:hypothetical protein
MAKPFVLTQRDVDILQSLSQVRYLNVQHLQWLHWTSRWRDHERAAREVGTINRRPKKAYERVAGLAERGLLVTIQRSADRAVTVYRRLAHCLSLTAAGAALLAGERGLTLEEIWHHERVTRAALTLEHSLGIGAFYAALRAETEFRGRRLEHWAADHVLCTDYDSVVVAGVGHALPIIPDATFTLDGRRYFLEIDRGTTRLEQWRKKALAYDAYTRDPRMRERYGVSSTLVLVVMPAGPRMHAIARTVAAVHNGSSDRYRFLSAEHVHPFSIRRRWQRMEQVTFTPGRRPGDLPQPNVTLSETALWTPTAEEPGV